MSAFDDEFGLFGDEDKTPDEERTSTLGARRIASDEAAHDDIEPEDERPRRGRGDRRERGAGSAAEYGEGEGRRPRREYGADRGARKAADPVVAQQRALDLLKFLARKLVSRPDNVIVEEVETEKGPVVELVVEHEDLGKVIGRSGRVAQALRTLVRASAEGRISIDIISFEDEVVATSSEQVAGDADADAGGDTEARRRPTSEANAGRVTGVFGLRGELKVAPSRVGADALAAGIAVRASLSDGMSRALRVRALRLHQGRPLVTFDGVEDANAALELVGATLFVDRAVVAMGEGEYFDDDLVGCALVDPAGTVVGHVVAVEHYPAQDVLLVGPDPFDKLRTGGSMVPLVRAFVRAIDVAAKRIAVDLPPGLLDPREADEA